MKTPFYIKLGTEVLITWATVFIATFHRGIDGYGVGLMIAAMVVQGGRDVLKEFANPDAPALVALRKLKPSGTVAEVAAVAGLVFLAFMFSGCAHTNFSATDCAGHSHGVAHFEGDMVGQSFTYYDGKTNIAWNCTSVSHSAATQAQGQAADTTLGGVATVGTSAGMAVATSGMLPGGLGALFSLFHRIQ